LGKFLHYLLYKKSEEYYVKMQETFDAGLINDDMYRSIANYGTFCKLRNVPYRYYIPHLQKYEDNNSNEFSNHLSEINYVLNSYYEDIGDEEKLILTFRNYMKFSEINKDDDKNQQLKALNVMVANDQIMQENFLLNKLTKELEEKSNLSDSKAGSQNDELFESVTKKQIQLLKKELELNSRENELKNKVLNVSSKDIAQYKFDSVKYNKSYDVETALKHYETDPKSAIEELRDMAIYSRSNKEYMVAYLALKKLINDNSEFLELIKEIETAKTKQKLEIERFISTLNVEKNKLL